MLTQLGENGNMLMEKQPTISRAICTEHGKFQRHMQMCSLWPCKAVQSLMIHDTESNKGIGQTTICRIAFSEKSLQFQFSAACCEVVLL